MPKLVRLDTNEEVEITADGTVVGRERGCDLLLNSKKVSRRHAKINLSMQVACIEDLGSVNGTKVNGVRIEGTAELRVGDTVEFGEYKFQLVEDCRTTAELGPSTSGAIPVYFCGDKLPSALTPSSQMSTNIDDSSFELNFVKLAIPADHVVPPANVQEQPSATESQEPKVAAQPQPNRRLRYTREACGALFVSVMFIGFLLGRFTSALGVVELPGERTARENLITEYLSPTPRLTPEQAIVEDQENEGESLTAAGELPAPEDKNVANSETINNSHPITESNSNDVEPTEEMQLLDSSKALVLLKTANRMGVNLRDSDAAMKLATEKLGMPTEQAKRVVNFAKIMLERRDILDQGIDGILKGDTLPGNKPTAIASPSKPAVSRNPPQINPNAGLGPLSNANKQVGKKANSDSTDLNGSPEDDEPESDTSPAPPFNAESVPTAPARSLVPTASNPLRRGSGFYLNVWGLAVAFGVLLTWLTGVYWMGRDIVTVGIDNWVWLCVSCIAGPAGAIISLGCPDMGWGMTLNSACVFGPLLGYIALRDDHVPDGSRVLKFLTWFEPATATVTITERPSPNVELLTGEVPALGEEHFREKT